MPRDHLTNPNIFVDVVAFLSDRLVRAADQPLEKGTPLSEVPRSVGEPKSLARSPKPQPIGEGPGEGWPPPERFYASTDFVEWRAPAGHSGQWERIQ